MLASQRFELCFFIIQWAVVIFSHSHLDLLYNINRSAFSSFPYLNNDLKTKLGRLRYFTVWSLELNALQITDAIINGSGSNIWLQYLALTSACIVSVGVILGPPIINSNNPERIYDDPFSKIIQPLFPEVRWVVASFLNLWGHGGMAVMAILQASLFCNPDKHKIIKSVGKDGLALILLLIAAWIIFTEMITKYYARTTEQEIAWPYGEKLTRFCYILFPVEALLIHLILSYMDL